MERVGKSPLACKDEGRAARYRGDPVTANPYGEGTPEHDYWRQAWEHPDEIVGEDKAAPDRG